VSAGRCIADVAPPSTKTSEPGIQAASGEARNNTAPTPSSGWPSRPSGIPASEPDIAGTKQDVVGARPYVAARKMGNHHALRVIAPTILIPFWGRFHS